MKTLLHLVMDGGLAKDGTFALYNTVAPKGDRVLPLFSLKGKTAIVSGAGAGIGMYFQLILHLVLFN